MKTIISIPLAFIRLVIQSIYLALGQIWANKTRSALTTIGIVIGIASVTAVIAALTGLRTKILDEFESFGTNKIYIAPEAPKKGPLKDKWWLIRFKPEHFKGLLKHCPSVETYTRMCGQSQTIRYGNEAVESVNIRGIDPSWHKIEHRSVLFGRPFSMIDQTQARQVCLVTPTLRDKLRLDKDCTGQTIVIGRRSFMIVGVVEEMVQSGMFGGGGTQEEAFIPFNTAWKIYSEPWIWAIASCRQPELSEDAQAELRFFLRRTRHIKPGQPDTFRLDVIQQFMEKFNEFSVIMTAVAGGVVGISLLVGGVGIMNIMLVSVSERTREIGLRKAVGARPSAILLQFLIEAVILCLFGGLIGVICGQLMTTGISHIPNAEFLNKAHIPLWAIGLSFGFSALVGVCFGIFPAMKAAQLDPIEALRHE